MNSTSVDHPPPAEKGDFMSLMHDLMQLIQKGQPIGASILQLGMKRFYNLFRHALTFVSVEFWPFHSMSNDIITLRNCRLMGFIPGLEFQSAIRSSRSLSPPARIELGDRDVMKTMERLGAALPELLTFNQNFKNFDKYHVRQQFLPFFSFTFFYQWYH